MSTTALSVIVIARNTPRSLEYVLDGIAAEADDTVEVVVVDDGSEPPLGTLRGDMPMLRVLRLPSVRGRAAARNAGAAVATGSRLLFLDGDMVPGPGLLDAHSRYGAESTVVMGYRNDLEEPSPDGIQSGRFSADSRERFFLRYGEDVAGWILPWQIAYTHNLSVARRDFEDVGGFDESFLTWGSEDDELAYRLYHARAEFVFDRMAVAFHLPHDRDRQGELASNIRNSLAIVAKHRTVDVELLHHFRLTHYVETQAVLRTVLEAARRGGAASVELEQAAESAEAPCLVLGAAAESRSTDQVVMSHPSLERSRTRESLFGVALPFADQTFATVLVGPLCFAVPELVGAVLDEAQRVGAAVVSHASTDQ